MIADLKVAQTLRSINFVLKLFIVISEKKNGTLVAAIRFPI